MVVAQNCRMMQGDLLIVLTPGEPIRITKVLEGTGFNQGGIRALGEVRGYEFEYYWGGRLTPLLLAPWENGEFDPGRCMGTILQSCSSLQELDNE